MRRRARLPGTADEEQIVCHVDMDCFYAACERLREPPLRGEPLVVGMGYEPGETDGAVATASYEAREFGIESAQAISTALEQLPRKVTAANDPEQSVSEAGFYRPVDMEFYESVASDVKEILHERAAVVREVSIDEAYLDVTDRTSWETVRSFAGNLKDEIAETVGVAASIGVAPTLSAAKVASDHDKPDGLVVVEPGDVASFLAPLDVEAVHGVGPVTAAELRSMGIETAGDLATADPAQLGDRFGERGRRIHRFARGEDDRPVEPQGNPKSFSRESAFTEATTDTAEKREQLQTLATAVADRTRSRDVLYQTISVKVVTPPFDIQTRARSLPGPVEDAELLERVALDLLDEFEDEPVRKLGVRVSNLSFTDEEQPSLAAWASADEESATTERADEKLAQESSADETEQHSETEGRPSGQQSLTDFE